MEQHISEVLKQSQHQQLTLKEVLETYSDIELTEDEIDEAIILAKYKKKQLIQQAEVKRKIEENRKLYTQKATYDIVKSLMMYRMDKVFGENVFKLDDNNRYLFDLLCLYFGEDERFIDNATAMGIPNPSLTKGILLAGNFGSGKTWMMKLFCRNPRQCYNIESAKTIATEYKTGGELHIAQYIEKEKAAFEDPSVFHQKFIGLYIDDIGTEDQKSNFGDKKNVIGDLIEMRYFKVNCGIYLHGSTNLRADQLKEYYGERVVSRMREVFNYIELKGGDRRK